jgi:hypothetical protein
MSEISEFFLKLSLREMALAFWLKSELCGEHKYDETIVDFFHLVMQLLCSEDSQLSISSIS